MVSHPDDVVRLIGGLVASVGTAVASYVSSKAADQARQDILNATFGTETVPDLKGRTRDEATRQLGQTSLQLVVDPASSPDKGARVDSQRPVKDSLVRNGSPVVVTLKTVPVPSRGPGAASRRGGPGAASLSSQADHHSQPYTPNVRPTMQPSRRSLQAIRVQVA
jgi:PASTA domain-containing protein